jgi:4-diphosphocytidyl-2-C-methyl-D-erythritol kinase
MNMRVLAPAKINLYLRIVGQRPDGYHLLDSLMIPISLYDEIVVEVRNGASTIIVTCDDPTVPTDHTNLAYKAAALLCQETGTQAVIAIALHKRIPAGAGLGGGSSDAAAVLKCLNTMLSCGLPEAGLCGLAARLGADVPFFVPGRPAQVRGIGELLSPIPALPRRWLVVVVPPFGVSTPWAYRRFDELSLSEAIPTPASAVTPGQWPPPVLFINDLERAVLPAYPRIAQIKRTLQQCGAEGALMSGSGSAVFGVFRQRTRAEQAAAVLRKQGESFLVEPLPGPSIPPLAFPP